MVQESNQPKRCIHPSKVIKDVCQSHPSAGGASLASATVFKGDTIGGSQDLFLPRDAAVAREMRSAIDTAVDNRRGSLLLRRGSSGGTAASTCTTNFLAVCMDTSPALLSCAFSACSFIAADALCVCPMAFGFGSADL